ncbi:ABC transporter substrate-binding protein [Tropicimonas sp. IMCC6043]|uniref:ABC transporter substrate-binding protein n=1 Tax=Tropicimonas sp. IMCC6043 TaxID=2510645 RepID=UPI00101C07F5|nr:ABC transporter substrate-binding protein [Tropicimonas sp. IMCC6043]RYH11315.1 twin-arginine translocation pathway signal protein [Tropicimonas sp. IMCC6043]
MQSISRRNMLRHSLKLGAGLTAFAALRPGAAWAADSVALQLGWLKSVQYAGSFIAEERGYYADEGLEVSLLPGGPNAPVDPVVISGQALVGVSATDYAARAHLNGAGYRILGAKNQRHAFCITSRADNPVRTPKDLENGPRLGLATINQPLIDAIARLNGLDASKINVVTTQGNPAPLANGEVDCFLTLFTTGPIALELQGIETYSFLLSDYGYNIFSGIYIATEDTLAARGDLVRRLLRAEIRGWQDFVEDIDYATQLTVEKYAVDQGLDPAQQRLQAQAQLDLLVTPETEANGLFWMSDEKIDANLATMDILGIEVDRSLFSRSILEDIYQGRARI